MIERRPASRGFVVLSSKDTSPDENSAAVVIKKYANRRLYNTASSTYVTLDDLAAMVKKGEEFVVYDAKTNEDITRSVLTQIIFEEESKGQNLLPINFLRQLIGYYGDSMQAFVPGYLELSMDNLAREQDKLRNQMMGAFQGEPFKAFEEQAKTNMAMFQQAMSMFSPFAGTGSAPGSAAPAQKPEPAPEAAGRKPATAPGQSDFDALRTQLSDVQRQLDKLAGKT